MCRCRLSEENVGRFTSGALTVAGKVGFFLVSGFFFSTLLSRALLPVFSPLFSLLRGALLTHPPRSQISPPPSRTIRKTTKPKKAGKQQRARWHPAVDRRMLVAGSNGTVASGAAAGGRFGAGMLPPPSPHAFNNGAPPPLYGGGPSHHSDAPPRLDDINTIWLDAGEGER